MRAHSSLLVILLVVMLQEHPRLVHGGSCWLNKNKNGKCSALVSTGGSKEDCCSRGVLSASATAAWSDEDLNPSSIFYMHIQGGVQCTKCKSSCEGVQCPYGQKCAMRKGQPKCVCAPDCEVFRLHNRLTGAPRRSVCGTDGRTYKSTCRLMKRACRKKMSISVAYDGHCKTGCSEMNCPPMKQCLLDQNLIPHCVNCSQRHCSHGSKVLSGEKSVCAVDGQTYMSVCHLREAACKKGHAIPVSYRGPCKPKATCESVRCSVGQKCLTEKNGRPRCVTCSRPRWCRLQRRHTTTGPICSSNNKTYKTWCDMMDDACAIGQALDTKHLGHCSKMQDSGEED